jgi:hypothetical protein
LRKFQKKTIKDEVKIMKRIRYIDGEIPFDRDGQHATGREVAEWVNPTSGGDPVLCWFPEYEGDDTVNLPCTE